MNTVYFDARIADDTRREQLYQGQLHVISATPGSQALVDVARGLIDEAFPGIDPETAQYEMPVEQFAAVLAELKPRFIHHPESKRAIQRILADAGCDLDQVYFDVPRMRTATSDAYLTTGIAYAFHPHRDTWYSAPQCQVNWWLPILELESDRSMAFHPHYWDVPIRNSSHTYNYAEWNRTSRYNAAQHVTADTRVQPKAEEPLALDPQVRVVTPPGGLLLFSAAHLHSSVPNTTGRTRFSIDFRTIHLGDARAMRGAPNVDAACTGTTMGDYLRGADLSHVPADVIGQYEPGAASIGLAAR